MKNLILLSLLFIAITAQAQTTEAADETNWPVLIIGIVITVVEIVARAVPNPKITGLIGLAVNLLKNISDYLNRGDK